MMGDLKPIIDLRKTELLLQMLSKAWAPNIGVWYTGNHVLTGLS